MAHGAPGEACSRGRCTFSRGQCSADTAGDVSVPVAESEWDRTCTPRRSGSHVGLSDEPPWRKVGVKTSPCTQLKAPTEGSHT